MSRSTRVVGDHKPQQTTCAPGIHEGVSSVQNAIKILGHFHHRVHRAPQARYVVGVHRVVCWASGGSLSRSSQ